jgi:phosphate/sulfate permease
MENKSTPQNQDFLWYLHRGVILTKDNLAKQNWKGSKACNLCQDTETIQHLFFECRFARIVWSLVFWALGIPKPTSTSICSGIVFHNLTKN